MQKSRVIQFTKDGHEKIKKEYDELLASRPNAVEHLKKARELGDLSENGYYKASRQKLSFIDSRLRELSFILKNAVLISSVSNERVGISTRVCVRDGEKVVEYEIVGDYEADPAQQKLSIHSPLGKALLDRKKGETIEVSAPAGKRVMEIITITKA